VITIVRTSIGNCYRYREVLYNLLARDLKIKYKHTFLGYFWSLLNPIFQLTVLAVVFSHIVRLGMKDYTLYLFSGLLTWTFFQTSLVLAAPSFLENENFIKKIYLPKILFPLSKVCLRGIDFLFSFVALIIIGAILGFAFRSTIIYLPFAIVILFIFTIGFSIIAAIAQVFFRDVAYLLTVFLQLLYFATPILYPLSLLPQKYHFYMKLNPLYSQVRLFQQLIYEGVSPSLVDWSTALSVALVVFLMSAWLLSVSEDEIVFRM
jgi:ABC-type polysaccharide/polyol phosphate export permease